MLRKTRDFQRVYRRGISHGSHLMVMIVRKSKGDLRVGFVCGKKVGNAVKRNRARRLLKENFRLFSANLQPGYDVIFIARPPMNEADFVSVRKTMEKLLLKAGILRYND